MEELTKEETLTNLYTLRAGLSVLAEIMEDIKNLESQQQNLIYDIDSEKEAIKDHERIEKNKREMLKDDIELIEEIDSCKEKTGLEFWTDIKDITDGMLIAELCDLISLANRGGNRSDRRSYEYSKSIMEEKLKKLEQSIALERKKLFKNKPVIASMEKEIEATKECLKNNELSLSNFLKEIEEGKKKIIAKWNKSLAESEERRADITKKENEIEILGKQMAEIGRIRFSPVYKVLKEQFSSFLDERDWGNVDLLIFNYETGRAATLKEALLQADMERRTERLEKAIMDAAKEISYSIRSGFGALQHSIDNGFNLLNDNIRSSMKGVQHQLDKMISQNETMNKQMDKIAEQNQNISSKLSEFTISTAQEALLNQMNVSSYEMAKDIRRVRELSEKTYYGY